MRKILSLCFLSLTCYFFSQEITHSHSIHHAFVENKGQWDKDILFKSHFQGGNLWVQQHKLLFHLTDFGDFQRSHLETKNAHTTYKQDVVHLNFIGANDIHSIKGEKAYQHYYNYFIGKDKSKWQSNVKAYSEATLENLYSGIDLKLIEEDLSLIHI